MVFTAFLNHHKSCLSFQKSKIMKKLLFPILFLATIQSIFAQTQTVKGLVVDQQSELPLIGVSIELLGIDSDVPIGTITDIDGEFSLPNVPVGRQTLRFSYLGYGTITLPDIMVTAGKEVVLEIGMAESVVTMDEIVVTAEVEKDKANNELATISARQFTLEEVTRYSGGRNDVSRMAANFAGVNIANDSRNDIVIRGNSPTGVLWRLEGIPIPNPNHFSTFGTTGGPVSALNTNLLKNSDFMTSAFPAEYGNALAGIFDLSFRSGNKDKYEFTAQLAAFSGLEFMAEGPLTKKKNSSFLVSYRHSFVELASAAGLNIGTAALPRYKDLTFKIDLPQTKMGKFSFFGIAANSNIDFIGAELSEDDFFAEANSNSYVFSEMGIVGMNHRLIVGENAYWRTTLSASAANNSFTEEVLRDEVFQPQMELEDRATRYSINSYFNKKFNAKLTLRTGFLIENHRLNNFFQGRVFQPNWETLRDFEDDLTLLQAYTQTQYKVNEKLTLNGGLHGQWLTLNDTWAIEPRLAANWHIAPNQTLSLGYGLHNQMQSLPIYQQRALLPDGGTIPTNLDLDFTASNQFVLGYDLKIGTDWRVKTEAYYQALSKVPVDQSASSFSILNVGADFGFPDAPYLVNEGTGENFGMELTVEKFFSKGYYLLFTGSVFESTYKGSDGIERNTAFNNNYTVNFLTGKEFKIGKDKRNAITLDTKVTAAGGRYYTPIDKERSAQMGREILNEDLAFSEQFSPYFRWDVKIGYQLNSKKRKFSQQFAMDFQNVTNHKNIFTKRYNVERNEVYNVYQIGFFPDVLWRVQF